MGADISDGVPKRDGLSTLPTKRTSGRAHDLDGETVRISALKSYCMILCMTLCVT